MQPAPGCDHHRRGGAPSAPNEAAQIQYATALAYLAARHPQVVGVQWDDWVNGGLDMRVSSPSGLQSGFVAAAQSAQDGGVDWLFSSNVAPWAAARNATNPFDDSTSSTSPSRSSGSTPLGSPRDAGRGGLPDAG